MKVGILGSGQVGQSLANGFLKYGYKVMIGTRNKSKLNNWLSKSGNNAHTGTFEETAQFGDIIVLAVKGTASKTVLESIPSSTIKGKTVIDATNPIADEQPENGVLKLFTSPGRSLLEELQEALPQVNFVKAFSCVGSALMVNPGFNGTKPTMFICGNDDSAKKNGCQINWKFWGEKKIIG